MTHLEKSIRSQKQDIIRQARFLIGAIKSDRHGSAFTLSSYHYAIIGDGMWSWQKMLKGESNE